MDIAASIQEVTEEVMLKICRSLQAEYKIPNLCLAGGVALNCVANGKIHDEKTLKIFGFSLLQVTLGVLLEQHLHIGI